EQDALAVRSHQRAVAARASGAAAEEIVALTVPGPKGTSTVVDIDEHPRADATPERLATLRPIRLDVDPSATVTAGNASGQNDAAAMCVVTTPEKAAELGLRPLVRVVASALSGVEPSRMGIGPVPATAR